MDTRTCGGQAPEDRNGGEGGASLATEAEDLPVSAATARLTQLEPGIELKMNAFVMWAGPMVLAALGVAPSEWTGRDGADLRRTWSRNLCVGGRFNKSLFLL